ncbi:MAG: S8/S53 family peptidase, partial [Bacteroidota bacterium]
GTEMAGVATAPRGSDGNAVGIAYNANLIGIRAVEDVIISSSDEKDGVKNALILAGNRSDVKVISMSIGTPFYSGTVADGVYYAYNKGKLIMAAAGTSLTWTSGIVNVIFPANMAQTTAITGVRDNNPLQRCNTCHDGSQVEFVMRMQRNSNTDRLALTLATFSDQPNYVGGSSCATASLAGISALVYASHPGASRSTVLNALKVNASNYPNKDSKLGWGVVDANGAVNY